MKHSSGTEKTTKLDVVNNFLQEIGNNGEIKKVISSETTEKMKNKKLMSLYQKWQRQHFKLLMELTEFPNINKQKDSNKKIWNIRMEMKEDKDSLPWIER